LLMKLFAALVTQVLGHGRLMGPPGRSSYRFFKDDPTIGPFVSESEFNYNDNELYCGGFMHQVGQGYKCGICGDAYDAARPRENEWGGKHGKSGLIPRTYQQGSTIDLEVQVTAHHMGWFEFKICPMGPSDTMEPEQCFSSTDSLMEFTDGTTRWEIPPGSEGSVPGKTGWWYSKAAKLPEDLSCDHCVIQWHWHTANSWACDDAGNCGLGYGEQEEFYGCSDIAITSNGSPNPTTTVQSSTTKSSTTKPTTTFSTTTERDTQPPTTQSTTIIPTNKPDPTDPPMNVKEFCEQKGDGIHAHPGDCTAYISCTSWDGFIQFCAPGLAYNPDISGCDWPHNVNC